MGRKSVMLAAMGLIAVQAMAGETESCWMEMERAMLGTLLESGSFLYYSEEGTLERASYKDKSITQFEPEPGVYVVEWDFPELNDSGTSRFDLNKRTLEVPDFEPKLIEVKSVECSKSPEGAYTGVKRFVGTINGTAYEIEDTQFVLGQAMHNVRSLRPAGTNEPFGPVGVYFSARQSEPR